MKRMITSFAAVSLMASSSLACMCLGISTAGQVAQDDNVVVAKVKTISYEHAEGKLQIEKSYKGVFTDDSIYVTGQNGFNCAGSILTTKDSWVAVMYRDAESGDYQMVSCADSSLPVDPAGQVQVNLDQPTWLNEADFTEYILGTKQPTVKGVSCRLGTVRNYISGFTLDPSQTVSFDATVQSQLVDGKYVIDYTKDLSQEGKNVSTLQLKVSAQTVSASEYRFDVSLVDPYLAKTADATAVVDIKQNYEWHGASLYYSTDLNGVEKEDFGNQEAYLSHHTYVGCSIDAGLPLVATPVK